MTAENMMLVYLAGVAIAPLVSVIGAFIAITIHERREKREEREREERDALLRSYHRFPRFPHPAPKPDAAKECGLKEPPRFDTPRKTTGRIVVVMTDGKRIGFRSLAEFGAVLSVSKHALSPADKMDAEKRLRHIAARVAEEMEACRFAVRTVVITRDGKRREYRRGRDI